METKSEKRPSVLVVHGPNLNMLGVREPDIYGSSTLADIDAGLTELGSRIGVVVETFQSNHEGAIVEKIQQAIGLHSGLIINPAAFTHTSIAIRDALLLLRIPIIEVHLSNIDKRESFRHTSLVADIAAGRIAGFGSHGYSMALEALARMLAK